MEAFFEGNSVSLNLALVEAIEDVLGILQFYLR